REIRSVIESIWTFAADSGGPGLTDCVLPDVGAEIICRIDEPCVFVRGPQFQVEEIAIPSSARYVGARLRPGAASPLLGIPAADVCRSRIPMEAIGVAMAKELWDIGSADATRDVTERFVQALVRQFRHRASVPRTTIGMTAASVIGHRRGKISADA